jgi:predicted transcriptional regulator
MAVFRTEKTEDFTIMSNYHFKDKRLSMKAKGLLSMMLSFADDWQYSLNGLAAVSKEGLTAIRATVQELEDNGYIVRRRLRNGQGRLSSVEYDIYEIPLS